MIGFLEPYVVYLFEGRAFLSKQKLSNAVIC